MPIADPPPAIVLDTNVVFDWLLFDDPRCASLGRAIETGAVRWIVTQPMLDELSHVVRRGSLDAWQAGHADLERRIGRWSQRVTANESERTAEIDLLRCSDPDDQKFIDLALSLPARWLLTRDNALLRLRRRAVLAGVSVSTPVDWLAPS
jgi:putative PIN family toxin of toxin-antitoxin system